MCKKTEKQVVKKMRLISKPVPGLDFRTWDRKDVDRWWELIRANHHSPKDLADIARLRDKYKLEKYYSFRMDRS